MKMIIKLVIKAAFESNGKLDNDFDFLPLYLEPKELLTEEFKSLDLHLRPSFNEYEEIFMN